MKYLQLWILLVVLFVGWSGVSLAQQADENRISAIRIEGNQRIATETFLYYVSVKPGDVFDETLLRNDFKRLWQTGFLNDLRIEIDRTPVGIEVIISVVERPLIKLIEYTGGKKVSEDDIREKLKDESILMRIDQPFDPYQAQKAVNVINKLMADKGLQFGNTTYRVESLTGTGSKLVFVLDEGPKAKIGEIDFVGNKVFSDDKLRGQMKDIKEKGMFTWITKKDDFEKEKFEEDMGRVEDFYFNNGFINAHADEPEIELLPDRKKMKITIPVHEGFQFKVGEVHFEGNTVFPSERLKPMIPLKSGKVFDRSKLKAGIEDIQKMYGDEGYIYASLGPVFDIQEETRIVNLKIDVQENGQFIVNRIEFTGNDFTRDKVIRREMRIQEGELLRVSKFRDSIDRIYRLGFFEDMKPNITPVAGEENRADISVEVKENKRNEIRVGGGYSELEGFFGDLVFSTRNLFGTGKVFSVNFQSGTRTKLYGVSILEPYFMDRRIAVGINVRRYRENFFSFIRDTVGGSISFGFPIVGELNGVLIYGYDVVDVTRPTGEVQVSDDVLDLFPGLDLLQNDRIESKLIPQLVRNTINNPIDPSRGSRLVLSNVIAGGFLGGEVNYWKPNFTFAKYLPGLTRSQFTAFNLEGGYATGFGGLQLPFYERYFLGGEQTIRGYDVRIVAPVLTDPLTGVPFIAGGNKYFLVNLEYVMTIAGPLKLAGFLDYGNAFLAGENVDFTDMRGSTGLEIRFNAPFISAPFRLIYAVNFNRGELMTLPVNVRPKRTQFRFSVGTTF